MILRMPNAVRLPYGDVGFPFAPRLPQANRSPEWSLPGGGFGTRLGSRFTQWNQTAQPQTPQMFNPFQFNMRLPSMMQPNWRQALAWQPQQQQQQNMLPSLRAPLRTNTFDSYDWTS